MRHAARFLSSGAEKFDETAKLEFPAYFPLAVREFQ